MNRNSLLSCIVLMTLYTIPIHANLIWPAMFVAATLNSSLFLIFISIIIEGLLLRYFIKTISYSKALLVSLIGNVVSTFIGAIYMAIMMLFWHFTVDQIVLHITSNLISTEAFNVYTVITTYILMYLGSSIIELVAIRLFFNYTTKQLLIPVLIGNFITYGVTALYQFQS